LYELSHETEKVVNEKISKVERTLHMKEEEVVRLKQILYGKEDIIRKISVAYEQSKTNVEEYVDEISYYKQEMSKFDQGEYEQLLSENQNFKIQNKQLLVTIMKNLTKSSRKGSKKRSRLNGTLINSEIRKKSGYDTHSKRRQQKRKKSYRKHSSKRKYRKEIALNNFNSLLDYRKVPSLSVMNKNLVNIHNNQMMNNYQSFDSTFNNTSVPEKFASSVKNGIHADEQENRSVHQEALGSSQYHSIKTPQQDRRQAMSKKGRPKTAVRREKDIRHREDLHSTSQQVAYEQMFAVGDNSDNQMSPNELEQFRDDIRNGNIELVEHIDPNKMQNYNEYSSDED